MRLKIFPIKIFKLLKITFLQRCAADISLLSLLLQAMTSWQVYLTLIMIAWCFHVLKLLVFATELFQKISKLITYQFDYYVNSMIFRFKNGNQYFIFILSENTKRTHLRSWHIIRCFFYIYKVIHRYNHEMKFFFIYFLMIFRTNFCA